MQLCKGDSREKANLMREMGEVNLSCVRTLE